jgi:hypothetical protein
MKSIECRYPGCRARIRTSVYTRDAMKDAFCDHCREHKKRYIAIYMESKEKEKENVS